MFNRIVIELSGPICGCDEQDLSWNVPLDEDGKTSLEITCRTCKSSLKVGSKYFKAAFKLDTPYVKVKTEKKDAKILQLVPDLN